jgi:hypothetical protein
MKEDRAMAKIWRHGDVLIGAVDDVPAGARPLSHVILARGEVTGHSHRIAERGAAQLYEINGVLYLDVVAALATLIHEEHGPITLPQGRYRVWIQREYAPGEIRRVYD